MSDLGKLAVVFAILLAGVFMTAPVAAAATNEIRTERTTTTITPEKQGFAPGEVLRFAIRQEVAPDWHVFWVNPGDAGLPLALDWSLPDGFTVGDIVHPVPEKIPVGPLASFAHEGAPVFVVSVEAPPDLPVGGAVDVAIDAQWQVCATVCILESGAFSLSLPVLAAPVTDTNAATQIADARRAAPNGTIEGARLETDADGYLLSAPWDGDEAPEDVFFFPTLQGLTEAAADQPARFEGGTLKIAMTPGYETPTNEITSGLIAYRAKDGARAGKFVTAAVAPAILAQNTDADTASNAGPAAGAAGSQNALFLLLLAFGGGLILNVMPCVFPILFVKAASLATSGGERGAMRRHGLLYTAGVLTTFLLMGGALLALRAGGEELGWGFHLQSPLVVALSAYTLLLVGLNLAGVFHVGESIQGAGGALTTRKGAAGSFFTGFLAVVVAAPCIGPLLSAPMGAALLQPASIGLLIFLCMALGLAAPYLLLSFAPAFARALPRPGPWMEVLKQAMAFPVFAAAAYFLWVLSRQTGADGLAIGLSSAVFLAFAAWSFERSKADGISSLLLRIAAGVAAVVALAPLGQMKPASAQPTQNVRYGAFDAAPFDEAAISGHLAEGRPVFASFTAAWCVTCQVDKMTIFSNDAVAGAFARENAVLMVGDWTLRDERITSLLETFGASGVPFYVYYPVSGPPQVLPIPLTRAAVLNAVSPREAALTAQ